jgi:TetR/AcrR family transcriptional regulator, transcriptional repressor of aconitase
MPRPRFLRATPAVQQAVLDAAALEFSQHGYDGASLNRILLAAGLSKGAFYYYFDDKADLAAAVLERELSRWDITELEVGATAAEFWLELRRYIDKSLEQLRGDPSSRELLTRLGSAISREPTLLARLGPVMARAQQHLIAVWQHGQEVGAVRTDLPASTLVAVAQAMKHALAQAMLPGDRGASDDDLAVFSRTHLDLVRRIAEPREEPKP